MSCVAHRRDGVQLKKNGKLVKEISRDRGILSDISHISIIYSTVGQLNPPAKVVGCWPAKADCKGKERT